VKVLSHFQPKLHNSNCVKTNKTGNKAQHLFNFSLQEHVQ